MDNNTGVDPYLDRAGAASDITANFYPVTARALRDWSQPRTITIGGRACAKRSEWRAEAERRLREAQFVGADVRKAQTQRARQAIAAERGRAA